MKAIMTLNEYDLRSLVLQSLQVAWLQYAREDDIKFVSRPKFDKLGCVTPEHEVVCVVEIES